MVELKPTDKRIGLWRAGTLRAAAGISMAAAVSAGVHGTVFVTSAPATVSPAETAASGFYAHLSDLRFVDQEGRAFRPAGLQGKVVLLNFVFTGCASTCPVQTRELAALQRALPASLRRDVRFLSVSVDPLGDTPARLRAYGQSAGADFSSWTFATGRPQDIERLGERLRLFRDVTAAGRPEDHTTSLWLVGGNGQLMQRYVGVGIDRARFADDIAQVRALGAGPG